MGTPESSTNETYHYGMTDIVESGIKHHKPNPCTSCLFYENIYFLYPVMMFFVGGFFVEKMYMYIISNTNLVDFISYSDCSQTCVFFFITDAVKNIIQFMGMQPCERSDKVPDVKSSHTLFLSGVYRGGHDALVRAKLAMSDSGVTMQLTVRSTDPYVSEVLVTAIG